MPGNSFRMLSITTSASMILQPLTLTILAEKRAIPLSIYIFFERGYSYGRYLHVPDANRKACVGHNNPNAYPDTLTVLLEFGNILLSANLGRD